MPLYLPTLAVVSILITAVLGLMLLFAWVQDRGIRALAWWGAAYLVGGFAVALISITDTIPDLLAVTLANALLFIACGLSWNGARLFDGRSVRPFAMLAGAIIWLLAFRIEGFAESAAARVVVSSLIVSGYTLLAAFELWHGTSERLLSRWPAVGVFTMHALFFSSQIPLMVMGTGERTSSSFVGGWLAILALETLLYVIATAFIVLAMAKERSDRFYKTAASTDPLTGVANRRALLENGQRMMRRQARYGEPLAALMFDIDHFKSINDRFGHAVGDLAIKLFADTAAANLRSTDLVGRYGGEEFAALLPNTCGGRARADRLRRSGGRCGGPPVARNGELRRGPGRRESAGNERAAQASRLRALHGQAQWPQPRRGRGPTRWAANRVRYCRGRSRSRGRASLRIRGRRQHWVLRSSSAAVVAVGGIPPARCGNRYGDVAVTDGPSLVPDQAVEQPAW